VASSQNTSCCRVARQTNFDSVLIFSRTKHGADRDRPPAEIREPCRGRIALQSHQRERVEALDGFKSGKYELMVATDIAARRIDVEDIAT